MCPKKYGSQNMVDLGPLRAPQSFFQKRTDKEKYKKLQKRQTHMYYYKARDFLK